jgi:hypothetical protein
MSRRRTVGGVLDLAGYERLYQTHRPSDSETLGAEARRLHRSGHSPQFIAKELQLPLEVVSNALAELPAQ